MLNWEGIGPELHVESTSRTRDDFQSRTQSPQLPRSAAVGMLNAGVTEFFIPQIVAFRFLLYVCPNLIRK